MLRRLYTPQSSGNNFTISMEIRFSDATLFITFIDRADIVSGTLSWPIDREGPGWSYREVSSRIEGQSVFQNFIKKGVPRRIHPEPMQSNS
jgi:hypothetical protein